MKLEKRSRKELLELIGKLEEQIASLESETAVRGSSTGAKDALFELNIATVLDNALDAVIGADQAGRIVYWNPRAEHMFGWSKEEVLGLTLSETIIPSQYREAHRKGLEHFNQTGEGPVLNRRLEMTALRRDGTEFPVEMSVGPLKMGNFFLFSSFIQDITERKQVIEALKAAREAADKANKSKDQFLAQVSHELRTPLNGIYGMVQLALDTSLTEEQREYLDTVKTSTELLTGIVDELLDFSKIESGQLVLFPEPIDLRERLNELLRIFIARARDKNLEIVVRVQDEVPRIIVADWNRLRQILLNLVGNALKFTDEGKVEITVGVDAADGDSLTLRWQVRDTGIGISEAHQQVIFDAFVQADSSVSRKYGGTGLGLTIAHNLVQLMDGWIWLESAPGEGSSFTFNIKVQVPDDIQIQAAANKEVLLSDLPVLIVDDNSSNRKILARMVENWGMKPTTASSASSAVDRLLSAYESDRPFRLVLVDYAMPECNGLQLVEQIRADQRISAIEIIMISSVKEPALFQHARLSKVSDIIIKPVSEPELLGAVMKCVKRLGERDDGSNQEKDLSDTQQLSRSFRILIAEDDRVNQIILKRLLEKRGHVCTVVPDGQAVLEELKTTSFDAIIMDVQMPIMDGITTTLIIRAQEEESGQHIPIVASTAFAIKGDRERLFKAGMDSYISKPYSATELYKEVDTVCRRLPYRAAPLPPPLVDERGLPSLFGHDAELLQEAVASLLEEIPLYRSRLEQHLDRGEFTELEILAHSIKGAMANFRAEKAARTAAAIEESARGKDAPRARELSMVMLEQLDSVASLLAKYVNEDE